MNRMRTITIAAALALTPLVSGCIVRGAPATNKPIKTTPFPPVKVSPPPAGPCHAIHTDAAGRPVVCVR